MFTDYLKIIGLEKLAQESKEINLNNLVADSFTRKLPNLSDEEIIKLYQYIIPKISADGSCSIIEEPAEKPYNLAHTYEISFSIEDLKKNPHTQRLWRLNQIVESIFNQTHVDWFGIYRKLSNAKKQEVLAKEAYKGLFSRPEFPLTKDFAKNSNNSTVGLTGKAVIVESVATYAGPYYKCDGKVQSEFCLPIVNTDNSVIGIIDAESFKENHFTSERLLEIAKVAFDLGQINLGM